MSTVKRVLTALSLLMMTGTHAAYAEDVRQEWMRESSADQNDRLSNRAVRVDSSGNIYLMSTGGRAYSIRKYDTNGSTLWERIYGGDRDRTCYTQTMVVDAPGNVFVTGECRDAQYHFAVVTLKYDANGDLLWTAQYDEPSSSAFAAALVVNESGDATLAGFRENDATGMDYLTIRYDASGNQLWASLYDAGPYTDPAWGNVRSNDYAGAIALDRYGNVFVTGTARVHPANYSATQYATVKYDSMGRLLWVKTHDAFGEREGGTRIVADRDGNAYVVGTKLIKYDPYGNELWAKNYGAVACLFPGDAAITSSGNIVVTGSGTDESCIFDGPVWRSYVFQYFTGQYDSNGNLLWGARYHGPYSQDNRAASLALDNRGNVYVTGFSQAWGASDWDAATVKYDPSGKQLWSVRYDGPNGGYGNFASSLALDGIGNVYIAGKSWENSNWPGTVLVKYAQPSLNRPPVANAGPDQMVECSGPWGSAVALGGSGSSDPDGDALTCTWAWDGGSAFGGNPIVTLPLGAHAITLTVDDGKGGTSTDTVVVTVRDATPPTTVLRGIDGTAGDNGWYKSDVTIALESTDTCSGVQEVRYTVDGTVVPGGTATFAISAEGVHTVTYFARDNAGNSETAHPLTVKIDKTLPVITATVSPAPNANGWHNSDVTVTFACNDAVSGIASCSSPVTVTTEGAGQEVTGAAVDKAGNSASITVTVNIDKTPPALNLSVSPGLLWPPNHKMVAVTPIISVSDNLDTAPRIELVSVTSNEPDNGLGDGDTSNDIVINADGTISLRAERSGTGSGRVYTMTYRARDIGGNTAIASTTVTVPHNK